MKIAKDELDRLKKEIPAPQVLGQRINLDQVNNEWEGLCPFHIENTPSFKVYKGQDGTWLSTCHGACGQTWNMFQVLQRIDNISFDDAVEKAKSMVEWENGKVLASQTFSDVLNKKKFVVTYPMSALAPTERALVESEEAQKWLTDRGITLETAQSMNLGFIQNATAISPDHPWVDKGWIVIPYIDAQSRVVSLKYRSLYKKKETIEVDGKPKKISGILRGPHMATVMYNMDAIKTSDDVYVVEGEPDVWAMTQAGYVAVGLPMGSYNPTPEDRDKLMKANRIFLAGDNDENGTGQTAMKKLWNELRDRTYLIPWPMGIKDANAALLADGGTEPFRLHVRSLIVEALSRPVPDYYDLKYSLERQNTDRPMDNPRRLHHRVKEVDDMAVVLPGNVAAVFASRTGSGKTTWCLDSFELEEALNWGSTVLNYSAELSPDEFGTLVAANLLEKDRLELTLEDYREAARILQEKDARFYVGYNPNLNRIGMVLDSIEWAIKRLGANIVVLDHLHFLTRGEPDDIKAQSDAMQRIKNMAVKYQVIFVVVGQARKEQPSRRGRSADASDAKGSETFTSDASVVYLIHRNQRHASADGAPLFDVLDPITTLSAQKIRTKGPGNAEVKLLFVGSIGKFFLYNSAGGADNVGIDEHGS